MSLCGRAGVPVQHRVSDRYVLAHTKQAVLGIDIGGSGIKGAPVDLVKAIRRQAPAYPTPTPSTPKKVAGVVARIVEAFADHSETHPSV